MQAKFNEDGGLIVTAQTSEDQAALDQWAKKKNNTIPKGMELYLEFN